MSRLVPRTKDQIKNLLERSWLELGDIDDLRVFNVLLDSEEKWEDYELEFLSIMKNPRYFGFTTKLLFDIDLLPFQIAILKVLWQYKFPMLIGSRGCSKSFLLAIYSMLRALFTQGSKIIIVGAAFRQSKIIFEYMEDLWRSGPLFRSMIGEGKHEGPKRDVDRCNFYIGNSEVSAIPIGDGCLSSSTIMTYDDSFDYILNATKKKIWGNGEFRQSSNFLNNGIKDTKVITTKKGFTFNSTLNHRMKVCRNQEIVWVRADEMKIGDRILIDRSYRWHDGKFSCTTDEAYALGLMIGDGSWVNKYYLRYTTIDEELIDGVRKGTNFNFDCHYDKDSIHYQHNSREDKLKFINFWKLPEVCYTKNKSLPSTILSASRECMSACISGLFDTDGTVQVSTAKGGTSIGISFCHTSKVLIEQLHYILLHYGIISTLSERDCITKETKSNIYELFINEQNSIKFYKEIGFRLKRKQQILESAVNSKIRTTVVDDTIPDIIDDMIRIVKQFPRDICDESLSISKIQSRKSITFEYAKRFLQRYKDVKDLFINRLKILLNPDIFYDIIVSIKDDKCHTYDIEIPDGHEYCANGFFSHNSKIRGLRGNYVISDEFNSITREIFEVIIRGFGAVSARPHERVRKYAQIKYLDEIGEQHQSDNIRSDLDFGNQLVISGTAGYSFQSLYEYWNRYKSIIDSKGDRQKLYEIFNGEIPSDFNWKDYAVMRIPWHVLPKGFLDEVQIAQAKATMHIALQQMEYSAVFCADSDGFYKRSLIENCTCKPIISTPYGDVSFAATITGNPNSRYVYGIDPASEQSNFSIVVLECFDTHRRIVYVWSVTRQLLRERLKNSGKVEDKSFYNYCAQKIRDLMQIFPTQHIAMDAQGGGIAIMEALHDKDLGDLQIWPYIKYSDNDVFWWEEKNKPTDGYSGLHILHMIQFANARFLQEACHGLKMDMELKNILFPLFDSVAIAEAIHQDKILKREYDTLEDCMVEIDKLKDELTTITHHQTTTGRDVWDTPEIKLPGNKKGRLRKDRFSALIMANMVARTIQNTPPTVEYIGTGAYVGDGSLKSKQGVMYIGPEDIVKQMHVESYKAVKRY